MSNRRHAHRHSQVRTRLVWDTRRAEAVSGVLPYSPLTCLCVQPPEGSCAHPDSMGASSFSCKHRGATLTLSSAAGITLVAERRAGTASQVASLRSMQSGPSFSACPQTVQRHPLCFSGVLGTLSSATLWQWPRESTCPPHSPCSFASASREHLPDKAPAPPVLDLAPALGRVQSTTIRKPL